MGIYHALLVIVGFSFLIAIHELGHFLAAKRAGINCPVFSVGFPIPDFISKRLRVPDRWKNICSFHWRGTDYRIGWIPLGGFVQMEGQSDSPEGPSENIGADDDFRNVSYFNKVLVICGGVFMNAVTAVVFFVLAFMVWGVTFVEPVVGSAKAIDPKSGEVTPMWQEDRIQPGDRIVAVNGEAIEDFNDVIYEGAFSDKDELPVTIERKVGDETKSIDTTISLVSHDLLDFRVPGITQALVPLLTKDEAKRSDGELRENDTLLEVNGTPISSLTDVSYVLGMVGVNEKITVKVKRGGGDDAEIISHSYLPARKPTDGQDSTLGLYLESPVLVKAVQDGSPAATGRSGADLEKAMALRKDDQVLAIRVEKGPEADWVKVNHVAALTSTVQNSGGQALRFKVARYDGEKRVSPDPEIVITPHYADEKSKRYTIGILMTSGADAFARRAELREAAGEEETYDEAVLVGEALLIADVLAGSAADKAGLKAGQLITDVPDQPSVATSGRWFWKSETPLPLTSRFNSAVNAATRSAVADGEEVASVKLTIEGLDDPVELEPQLEGPESRATMTIGARAVRTPPITKGFLGSIESGFHHTKVKGAQILDMLQGLFAGDISLSNLSGPVMIVQMSYTLSEYGFGTLLFFLGFISINLAIINLLPLPVLDGGLLVFVTIEKLIGRPIPEKFMQYTQIAGTVALVALLIYVVFNDIKMLSLIG